MDLPVYYNDLHWTQRRLVRLEYIKIQKGLCYHCGQPLTGDPSDEVMNAHINTKLFPDNFFKYPVHLHHDHQLGLTIGAIHNRCNAYLWQYKHE